VCACACVRVCACACACVRVHVRVCVRVREVPFLIVASNLMSCAQLPCDFVIMRWFPSFFVSPLPHPSPLGFRSAERDEQSRLQYKSHTSHDLQVTQMNHVADKGWLQLVGSIKLQVSFAKETYKRDNILQKRPIILSILLTVATP